MHYSVEGFGITGDESLGADSEVKDRFLRTKQCQFSTKGTDHWQLV